MLVLVITVVMQSSIVRVITYAGFNTDPTVVTNVPTFPSTLKVYVPEIIGGGRAGGGYVLTKN